MSTKISWRLGCRWLSHNSVSVQSSSSQQLYVKDPIKLIAIPITTHRVFVYHKHSPSILNVRSKMVKYETKLIDKVSQTWNKLEKSPRKFNRKIVASVSSLLNQTPWTEDSLNTVPSENYIMKRVKENDEERLLTFEEWFKNADKLNARPVHLYYPESVCSETQLRGQLQALWTQGLQYHKKHTWLSLLGIPLTLPLVLVPVVPNVPGFYLLYRAYRNFKAYNGAKHLKSLVENESHSLVFTDLLQYSTILQNDHAGGLAGMSNSSEGPERVLLDEKSLDRILDTLEIHEIRSSLLKALKQENLRLGTHK
ncbi:LAME_0B05930g1_1 [Lachancea meyersii CBS 8951]|uniref:LAME_0B05930g1_1 n=1 Tax=Lachancea meyersii CBS 8951 TaxID=1266667 RepID=A0A1G4IVW0_9SACH|nr:LAME_0B05930g1_1 [Lachancea meyersii CBS 8951]